MSSDMRPFFTYYGGKWRSAPKYSAPTYGAIVEPFAGSAGYSVRHNAPQVTLIDRDLKVIGTWQYLIRATPEEILSLPDIPDGGSVEDLSVCQEARWFIGWWLNKGASSPRKTPSRWMRDGTRPNSYWGPTVRSLIASQVPHIKHWWAREGDYRDAHDIAATWFIDPPYQVAGSHYRMHDIDYDALGKWCKERKGQVIVCEAQGADWLPFEPAYEARNTPGKQKQERVTREVVWMSENYEWWVK